jgi:hypothetical protein
MSQSAAIYSKLSGDTALSALVGTRIFPAIAPANTATPYVVWQKIASSYASTHAEAAGQGIDLIQFACFASTFDAADAVRAALISTLDNQSLSNGAKPQLDDERDSYEESVELFRCDADFTV